MAEEPVSQRWFVYGLPGQAGAKMQLRDRDVVRADSFADFTVITILEPFGGNDFLLPAKPLSVGPGQLGPGKEAGGLENRAVGRTD